jgi:hypothetical protein
MSIPSPSPGATGALDERRLRAVLRLVLVPDRADLASERILRAVDPLAAVSILASDLNRERHLSRIISRLPFNRRHSKADPPTHAPESVSARAFLALLMQVGLDIDGERLEDAFGIDSEELGRDLLNARAAFSSQPIVACRELGWVVGRYRDRGLATEERVRLLSHSPSCDTCKAALDRAQQADAALLTALERELERLPEREVFALAARPQPRYGSLALAAGAVVIVVVLLAAVSAIERLVSSPEEPAPLFTGDVATLAPLDGWLLQVSPVGYLEAVNFATGHKRGLDSGDSTGTFSPLYRVSRTHIAAWRPSDGQREDVLTIGPIGEQVDFRLTWNRQFVYWYPSGWLDDDTLLIVKSPEHVSGESEQQYIERLSRESRLIAFDAVTGDERVLMTGNVAAAYPSPDGTMLAILQPVDRRWPGLTLELRPFDGLAIGDPIVRIEHRVIEEGFWLADSSRFVTTVIADETITMDASASLRSRAGHGVRRVALEGIARNGDRYMLAAVDAPELIVPISAAPDSQSIVYQVRSELSESEFVGVPAYDWRCYRMPASGGEAMLLTAGRSPERIFRPAWSPDGTTLVLPVARAFPLSTDGAIDQPINPNATTLLVFRPDWHPGADPQLIYSSGRDLYGWLAPGALDARAGFSSVNGRTLAAVVPDAEEMDALLIDAGSIANRSGAYLVADERGSRMPLIWSVDGHRQRRLPADTADIAWFNQGTATIGVARGDDPTSGSRIVLNVADISRSAAYLDRRYYDPAYVGDSTDLRYALPLVSPSGTTVSFFVVDRVTGQVSLWLDDSTGSARTIANWTMPDDRIIEPPIVAEWVSADTLLFVRPVDWKNGMPRSAVLARLVIAPPGGALVDDLVHLDASRGAQGVALVELALSPDATQLAYRLRHFESGSADSASDDTLHVAGTDDLGHAIELERGGNGEGLVWTATGDGISAGVRGRIVLYSPDGRDLEYLSPRGVESSNPVLVGDLIWFEARDGGGGNIWQVDPAE